MDYDDIFTNYYTLYRAESQTPSSTDDEYTIGMRFANNAINRWASVDAMYWKELFVKLSDAASGTKTITSGTKTYAAPTDMREAGGFVKILDGTATLQNIPILEPQQAQFKDDNSTYCYFTGNPSDGFTLNLNPTPDASINGKTIEYIYYKKPTELTTGTDTTEVPDSWFIINHMLANRFRASRNWSGYQTALRDAEEALKNMQQDNNSGTWANPWQVPDNSGTVWGS